MHPTKLWRSLSAVLVALGLSACSSAVDSPLGPAKPSRSSDLLDALTPMNGALWKWTYDKDITVSKTIGKSGGSLSIGESGFTLIVPPGAVLTATKFSITAVMGDLVAFEFEPHGAVFNVPLIARQDLDKVKWDPTQNIVLKAGYFPNRTDLLNDAGTVLVNEVITGVTDVRTHSFVWPIKHFSGYSVAW